MRGRIGYAVDRFMPYVTGGLPFGDVGANINGFAATSDTNFGWTVGAGLEGALAPNWTAKIEYLYMDLGRRQLRRAGSAARSPATSTSPRTSCVPA